MTLEGHAEVLKLARLLGAEPAGLDYLEALAPADVRELRERAAVALHDSDRRFGRVALASRIPPAPMTAWIAQHLFGALLCARIAGLLDPRRAIDLAKRMPPVYLADMAMQLDPRRVHDTAQGDALWDVVLPVTETMSEAGLQRLAALPALHAPEVLAAIADAAVASGLLEDLMPLMEHMPPAAQEIVSARIGADVSDG